MIHLLLSRANEHESPQNGKQWSKPSLLLSNHQSVPSTIHPMHSSSDDLTASSCKCGRIFNFSLTSPFTVAAKSHREFLNAKIKEHNQVSNIEDESEVPMERLKDCLNRIFYHHSSWESELMQTTLFFSAVTGFMIGAIVGQKERVEAFKKKFNHVQFEGEFHASRKLSDVVLLSTMKRASSLAVKFAFIPTATMMAFTCSMVYRNYINPLDFAVLVGSVFALYRINLGGKAMLSAFIVGSGLGLIAGCIIWSIMKLSGVSVAEYQYQLRSNHSKKKEGFSNKSWDEWTKKMQEFKLLRDHDKMYQKIVSPQQIEKELDNVPDAVDDEVKSETSKPLTDTSPGNKG